LLIHDIAQTIDRQQTIDMTVPWIYRGFGILIAVEDDTANVKAVIKPFQWPVYNQHKKSYSRRGNQRIFKKYILQVWLGLVISIVCVVFVLTLMPRYLAHRSSLDRIANNGNPFLYVIGNLLSQGLI
jgi:ionotropic glutamate receptor